MNLIEASWLPFLARNGRVIHGPPAAIVDPEFVDLALPREDFKGGAWQWLIGLLQTTIAPERRKVWLEMWQQPPTQEALQQQFSSFGGAFELFGSGPRFMQDLDDLEGARVTSVASLLIEAPGDQALKQNTDHFTKRGMASVMCPPCAAIALFTFQTTGPAGGTGYRVGIRGGGPLTTLVLPEPEGTSLWHKLLLNVFSRDDYPYPYPAPDPQDPRLFPWLGPTRTSEPRSATPVTTPEDAHPLHVYWAMPNRLRLEAPDGQAACQVCGKSAEHAVRRVRITNYGFNYEGAWQHPLTPYRFDPKKTDPPISLKGQRGGLGYRHWEALTLEDEKGRGHLPAEVVTDFLESKHGALRRVGAWGRDARLWVFGYDLKQNKPRGWYSTQMPLVIVSAERKDLFMSWVRQLVDASDTAARRVRDAVKAAWFKRARDAKGDFTFIQQHFWEATSDAFYDCLMELAQAMESERDQFPPAVARKWLQHVRSTAMDVFDAHALTSDAEGMDLKRVILARAELWRRLWSRKEKEMKGLHEAAEAEEEKA